MNHRLRTVRHLAANPNALKDHSHAHAVSAATVA